MLQINLNAAEGVKSIGDFVGVSKERRDEIAKRMAKVLADGVGDEGITNNMQLMKKVVEEASPETPEELFLVVWPLSELVRNLLLAESPFSSLLVDCVTT